MRDEKEKRKRYARNKAIREYYEDILGFERLDLQNMDKETKDEMFAKTKSLQLSTAALVCKPQMISMCIYEDAISNEENTMSTTINNIVEERRHLLNAIDSAVDTHKKNLKEHFAIDPYRPSSPKEAVDLILAGKFNYGEYEKVCDDSAYFKNSWINPVSTIKFVPKAPDVVNYNKAIETLNESAESLKLKTRVLDVEKTYPDVEAFKKKTFH